MDKQETERSQAELAELLAALKSDASGEASPGKPRLRKRPRPARELPRLLLGVGTALIVIGLVATVFRAAGPPPPEAVPFAEETGPATAPAAEAGRPLTPKEIARVQLASRVRESKVPRPENSRWIEVPHDYEKERARLLKSLECRGRGPKFFPVWELAKPAGGKPVTCYCLLRQPLDALMQNDWEKAGMFQDENEIISPFLRRVTVAGATARRNLEHPFVDRLTYSVLPEPEPDESP